MRAFRIIIILALGLVISCSSRPPIKIAIMTKLVSASTVGSSEINATRIFIEDNNINDIEIMPYDDQWNPDHAKKQYDIIRNQQIQFMITSHISACLVAIEADINRDRILTFATGATTDKVSGKNDFIFRNVVDVEKEQKSIAEYMNGNFNKLLIIRDSDNNAYTEPAMNHFKKNFKSEIVRIIDVSMDKLDLEALRKEIISLKFESVYLLIGGYKVHSGTIAQLCRQIKSDCPIMYTPWMKSPILLETAGSSLAGSILPSHYPPRGQYKPVDDYIDEYVKKYGDAPTFISLNVYSALDILNQIHKAGITKAEEAKDYILKTKTFNTRFGKITFNEYGDVDAPLYFITDIRKEFKQ